MEAGPYGCRKVKMVGNDFRRGGLPCPPIERLGKFSMREYGSVQFNRRQYPRLDFAMGLAFEAAEQKIPDGITSNVSLGGMLAYLPHTVKQGHVLQITMLLPCHEGKEIFKAQAEVVWVREGEFEGGWICQAGLRMLEMSADSWHIWRRFLMEWQGEQK